ncbi:MAG: hypothetical protein JHC23_00170 [Sulfolobus sp.]|nr:hypothetical protein [Sulfolobus sp.]
MAEAIMIDFHLIEEALIVIGIVSLPYGIYEILRGGGTRKAKAVLIGISLGLFIAEFLLTL